MKALTLLVVVAIGSLSSCTGISPGAQAKLDQAAEKYESSTGITPIQTIGLLGKWWSDYAAARQANAATEILRTRSEPATDWTSAKQVLQGIQPPQALNVLPTRLHDPEESPTPADPPASNKQPKRARPSRHDPQQAIAGL